LSQSDDVLIFLCRHHAGGLATSADIGEPVGVDVDFDFNTYFADRTKHVVRKMVQGTKRMSTIAGRYRRRDVSVVLPALCC
jgi:hypothetical protein